MRARLLAFAAALMLAAPAAADVVEASDSGFTISNVRIVPVGPEAAWEAIVMPRRWWAAAHSWSGSAANFSLMPVAGGCFCERWAEGSVEHARVIHVVRGRLLRLSGAFGPLQGEALTGTMTFTLTPEGQGTRISMDYVVGGHARFVLKDLAPIVDKVMQEQIGSLAKLLGG